MPSMHKIRHRGEVAEWLGLGFAPPEGQHGRKRRGIVLRHTDFERGHGIDKALVRAYGVHRERPIMDLLKPQQLDDRFWRMIYALMVLGGPIKLPHLYYFVQVLTDSQIKAETAAVRHYRRWAAAHARMARREAAEEDND